MPSDLDTHTPWGSLRRLGERLGAKDSVAATREGVGGFLVDNRLEATRLAGQVRCERACRRGVADERQTKV